MNDSDLLKMSFAVATFGLVLLFPVSTYSNMPVVKISELSYDDTGTKVTLHGGAGGSDDFILHLNGNV